MIMFRLVSLCCPMFSLPESGSGRKVLINVRPCRSLLHTLAITYAILVDHPQRTKINNTCNLRACARIFSAPYIESQRIRPFVSEPFVIAESASAAAKGDLSKLSVLLSPSDILHRGDKMNLLPVAEAQTKQIWSDWWKYFYCDIHAVPHNFPVLYCGFGEQLGLYAKMCGVAVTSHVGLPIFLQKPGGWFYSPNANITPLVFLSRKVNQLASESSDILKLPGSWWLARWMRNMSGLRTSSISLRGELKPTANFSRIKQFS